MKEISPRDAYTKLQNGALLLDVREEDECAEISCDVLNKINIPLLGLKLKFQELDKNQEIICICASGRRSSSAVNFLNTSGFSDVLNLQGGILAWHSSGMPVIFG